MQIGSSSLLSGALSRSMSDLKASFNTLTWQLSSGQVSQTYGGLGAGRSTSLAMHAQISQLQGYTNTIANVDLRIGTASTALTRLNTLASEQRSGTTLTNATIVAGGQTQAQIDARSRLDEALSVLGTDVAGSYLFGGRATDKNPVASADTILDGDGTALGLRGVIAERRTADIGTVNLDTSGAASVGRLNVSAAGGSSFTLAEDGTHPFGFKLVGGSTTMTGATISTPSGSPPSQTVSLGAQPTDGQTITLTMALPDGTTTDVTLTASANASPDDSGQFQIGATAAETAANLRNAVLGRLDTESQTTLSAASSVVAAQDFFAGGPNTPPKRVDITPPATAATATALRDATPTDTVVWYQGDDDPSVGARQSATAKVDTSLSVDYGVRANEPGIAKLVGTLALFAAEVAPAGDANATARNTALADRVRTALAPDNSAGSVTAITTELAGAQRVADAAKDRHKTAIATAQDLVAGVEQSDDNTVAASLLAVQTRLQASYQMTSMLSKLTLVNFLG